MRHRDRLVEHGEIASQAFHATDSQRPQESSQQSSVPSFSVRFEGNSKGNHPNPQSVFHPASPPHFLMLFTLSHPSGPVGDH